jgi:hypothetical protein
MDYAHFEKFGRWASNQSTGMQDALYRGYLRSYENQQTMVLCGGMQGLASIARDITSPGDTAGNIALGNTAGVVGAALEVCPCDSRICPESTLATALVHRGAGHYNSHSTQQLQHHQQRPLQPLQRNRQLDPKSAVEDPPRTHPRTHPRARREGRLPQSINVEIRTWLEKRVLYALWGKPL